MNALFAYLHAQGGELLARTYEHLSLTMVALGVALAIGLPLGLWLTRTPRVSGFVLGAVSVLQTIPSLALLGILIPFTGIGRLPATIALLLYALLPIVRNTVVGIAGVDPAVREAAVGMGMKDTQILRRVELPLALPIIFAGVRTATVVSVGVATLAALVGAGGLGVYIFRGISLADTSLVLAGAIPAALLALVLDAALGAVEKRLDRLFRPALVLMVALVALSALRGLTGSTSHVLRIAMPGEFIERKDGYPGLASRYALAADVIEMDHGLMYQALAENRVDAVVGYSTDGEIARFKLRVLDDDRKYFPPYWAAPLVRKKSLERHPELASIFDKLSGRIDAASMSSMNARVEHDHESPAAVAESFLRGVGMTPARHRRADPADVVIGSKIFGEQYVLAEMLADLVETYTPLTVKLATGLGGTKICFEALRRGDIDVYPEYTGTGLFAILGGPGNAPVVVGDARSVYDHVKREFDARYGLEWLSPLGFENKYALITRADTAARRGTTVSSFIDPSRAR
ncbi:MAG TPA: ABC transporter permease/substrate-binding protein [Polyangiaceae bacterium]|jgi:osmoprotectant transport system permease protein|nr:ABC transporter permease/substrate-binding protein [Polyangiaceae bacterium]